MWIHWTMMTMNDIKGLTDNVLIFCGRSSLFLHLPIREKSITQSCVNLCHHIWCKIRVSKYKRMVNVTLNKSQIYTGKADIFLDANVQWIPRLSWTSVGILFKNVCFKHKTINLQYTCIYLNECSIQHSLELGMTLD